MNEVLLVGRLGKDPELKTFDSGAKLTTATLATNENYKDKNGELQEVTQWHNLEAWRYSAEKLEKLNSGDEVLIKGKVKSREYDSEAGKKYFHFIEVLTVRSFSKSSETANAETQTGAPGDDLPF